MSGDPKRIMHDQIWRSYVGKEEERQLLRRSIETSPAQAVSEYIDRLDETFEPGTAENAPEMLENVLLQGIAHRLGGRCAR